jgi:hypothetical protein
LIFHRFRRKTAVVGRVFLLCSALACIASGQASSTDFGAYPVNIYTPNARTIGFTFNAAATAPYSFSLKWGIDFGEITAVCTPDWTRCTVTVNFTPKYPGMRQDAIIVTDNAGKVLATAFLHGIGVGPQLVFSPGEISLPLAQNYTSVFSGVAVDPGGTLYFLDSDQYVIEKLAPESTTPVIVAGRPGVLFPPGDNGPATSAALSNPRALTIDAAGNLFVLDGDRVRKIDAGTGIITNSAGGGADFYGDNIPATSARLFDAMALAADVDGNVYILEQSRQSVRKVDAVTGIISTVAGNGTSVYSGDGGRGNKRGSLRAASYRGKRDRRPVHCGSRRSRPESRCIHSFDSNRCRHRCAGIFRRWRSGYSCAVG